MTEEDIAEVVSSWTHIPVSRLQEGEREKLVKLEEHLHQRVVDQERGDQSGFERCASRSRRFAGSESSARLVHFSRTDRRRQNRALARARGIFIRRRERHDPDRHERIHGETHRRAIDRRAAGLRRLRGRRPTFRSGSAPAVFGRACSTRSKKRTRTCSTCCCKCSTTAGSRTGRGARSISRTRSSS